MKPGTGVLLFGVGLFVLYGAVTGTLGSMIAALLGHPLKAASGQAAPKGPPGNVPGFGPGGVWGGAIPATPFGPTIPGTVS